MNRTYLLSFIAGLTTLGLTTSPGWAADKISPESINAFDQRGFIPSGFKTAVHDLVDTQHELQQVTEEKTKLNKALPDLQRQAAETEAQAVALRQELKKYDHPEDNDFDVLQSRMNDSSAKPEEQVALAQAYVWTYPTSPHQAEAQQFLQQVQKKIADQAEAEQEAEAARVAAHARLVLRAQAKDLSPSEWRDFLRGTSQDDLVKLIGRPSYQSGDYWIYTGGWTTNPATHQKVGLQINFDAGRVLSVDEKPDEP